MPTRVKKDDRKALRLGPKPSAIRWWNSLISIPMNAAPSRKVTPSQAIAWPLAPLCAESMARP